MMNVPQPRHAGTETVSTLVYKKTLAAHLQDAVFLITDQAVPVLQELKEIHTVHVPLVSNCHR